MRPYSLLPLLPLLVLSTETIPPPAGERVLVLSTETIPPPTGERVAWLRSAVALGLSQTWEKIENGTGPSTGAGRDCTNAALAELLLSEDAAAAAAAAQRALALMRRCAPGPQFDGQAYGYILNMHRHRYNATDWAWVLARVAAATTHGFSAPPPGPPGPPGSTPMTTTPLDVSYSNMFFMDTVNAILFGEALADPSINPAAAPNQTNPYAARATASAAAGYAQLDAWLAFAAAGGNHEFLSPTYYWVQLNALHQVLLY